MSGEGILESGRKREAASGFEPEMEVLQTETDPPDPPEEPEQ